MSTADAQVSVVIPAYNAAAHLASVVDRIPPGAWDAIRSVWIVDDGSTDGTRDAIVRLAAARPRVRSVVREANGGYGAAMKAGLERARAEPVGAVACIHADGQYAPEELPRLLAAMRRRRLDLVQGSRHAAGTARAGGMPLYKYAAGHVLVAMENAVFRMRMSDFHSGYLCYGRRCLDTVRFEELSDSFDFDLEVIASCRAAGLRVGEEPIPTRYADEVSHLNPATYGLRVLGVVARYLAGRYRRRARGRAARR